MQRSKSIKTAILIPAIAAAAVFGWQTQSANAIKATDFNAGNIISDAVFYNKNAMTLAQIESFISSHTVACDTWGTGAVGGGRYINGKAVPASTTRAKYAEMMKNAGNSRYHQPPYVCLTNYYENPTTHKTSHDTGAKKETGMLSAAEIIYKAAQTYNINPQVLLVTLKKEYSYVYTDNWPLRDQYNTVMGYACPDSGPGGSANCSSKYYGFYNQVMNAAWQFNYYKENITKYNYQPYRTNTIQYTTATSCGAKQVYIENIATASLYIYTPYTPNAGALAAYPGTANCGSYGNRNFFMFFNEWFGSTYFAPAKISPAENDYYFALKSDYAKTIQLSANNIANSIGITSGARVENTLDTFRLIKNSDNTYTILNIYSGKVIDVPANNAKEGIAVQQYEPNNTIAQKWHIYENGNGAYSIASAVDESLVLTINANNSIILSSYIRSGQQTFRFIPTSQPIEDGTYNAHSKLKTSLVLDLAASGTTNGTAVQIYSRNDTSAQMLEFTYDKTTGYYSIINPAANKSFDVAASGTTNGTKIQIYDANDTCAQQWIVEPYANNEFEILSACSGKSLDVAGAIAANGTKTQLYDRNHTAAQKWILSEKTPPVPDGLYTISSDLNNNLTLDVKSNGTANGTNIWIYEQNNTAAQTFQFTYDPDNDYYTIVNPYSDKALDVLASGKTNGSNVQIYSRNNTCAQQWKIIPSANGTYEILSACSWLALDIYAARAVNGTNVQIYQRNNTSAQKWKLKPIN